MVWHIYPGAPKHWSTSELISVLIPKHMNISFNFTYFRYDKIHCYVAPFGNGRKHHTAFHKSAGFHTKCMYKARIPQVPLKQIHKQVQFTVQKMKNALFKSNANDQTPFVSPFPSTDSLSDKLHLANRRRLSILDMFSLICMSYMHVILFVGKSWHGQIQVPVGFTLQKENWRLCMGGGIEPGRVGKRCGRPLESGNLY